MRLAAAPRPSASASSSSTRLGRLTSPCWTTGLWPSVLSSSCRVLCVLSGVLRWRRPLLGAPGLPYRTLRIRTCCTACSLWSRRASPSGRPALPSRTTMKMTCRPLAPAVSGSGPLATFRLLSGRLCLSTASRASSLTAASGPASVLTLRLAGPTSSSCMTSRPCAFSFTTSPSTPSAPGVWLVSGDGPTAVRATTVAVMAGSLRLLEGRLPLRGRLSLPLPLLSHGMAVRRFRTLASTTGNRICL
mmetsp:Transcript_74654/g.196768  ORF Transcript_74654/g.196768 Transcript_74654/m.196768 type:complete len:246 (-) Transcript_74654:59-796(-)